MTMQWVASYPRSNMEKGNSRLAFGNGQPFPRWIDVNEAAIPRLGELETC
jgi:hypothetical protein